MSAPIGPGDFVECLAVFPKPGRPRLFVVGGIYRVSAAFDADEPFLLFFDVADPPPPHVGWKARYFRPIYRPDGRLIRDLLQPVKEDA